MRIDGRKRYVKRAAFAASLLNVHDFRLSILEIGEDEYGHVVYEGANEFLMCIPKNTPKVVLMDYIAHEMVHVAQYARGDMEDAENGTIWKGDLYDEGEHLSDAYFLSPWEMEARALESWITHRWNTRSKKHELYT